MAVTAAVASLESADPSCTTVTLAATAGSETVVATSSALTPRELATESVLTLGASMGAVELGSTFCVTSNETEPCS